MSKLNKSIDTDSKDLDDVPSKESVNFTGLPFSKETTKDHLRQIHDINIQTTDKPKFPPVYLDSRIVLQIDKGPIVKISKQNKKFKSINEEISYALSDHHQQQIRHSKSKLFKSKVSIEKSTESKELLKICRICKLNRPIKLIESCECKDRYVHSDCLAKLLEQTLEYEQCKNCKSNYKLDQFKIIKKRKSIWSFFKYNKKNFSYLIELPFYLGFIFFLLALGVIQYEQSYKIIYIQWSIILVFLIVLVILNHIIFFISNIYDLKNKIVTFRNTNFDITIQVDGARPH